MRRRMNAIGRQTFIDVRPPNDFYELFLVTPNENRALIEKVTLTPATAACLLPAKVEIASASVFQTLAMLLGATNPCTIPEKELRIELKRRKKSLVFSGTNVAMQVQCGAEIRIIRSDILDKDMFEPPVKGEPFSPILLDLSAGKYDVLFKDAPDRPSDLYRAAQNKPAIPSVQLQSSTPFQPIKLTLPKYPPIAKAAHVQGVVTFKIAVDANGGVRDVTFDGGSPLLRFAVKDAVAGWRFAEEAFNRQVKATVNFALNCPKDVQTTK
jgi:TonB family protein